MTNNKVKRKWDLLSEEERKVSREEIITFFKEKLDNEIWIVLSDEILDFFLQSTAEKNYNKAINDSKKLLKERFQDLEIDLELLLS